MPKRYFINLKIINITLISFLIMFFLLFLFQLLKTNLNNCQYNERYSIDFNNIFRIILLIFSPLVFIGIYFLTKSKFIYIYFLLFYSSAWSNFYDYLINESVKDCFYYPVWGYWFNLEDVVLIVVTFLVILNLIFYEYKKFKK